MGIRDAPDLPDAVKTSLRVTLSNTLSLAVRAYERHISPPRNDTEVRLREVAILAETLRWTERELVSAGAAAARAGATWKEVAEVSGHETPSAARRYFWHASPRARRSAERRKKAHVSDSDTFTEK